MCPAPTARGCSNGVPAPRHRVRTGRTACDEEPVRRGLISRWLRGWLPHARERVSSVFVGLTLRSTRSDGVEAKGIEPSTSCMPCTTSRFTKVPYRAGRRLESASKSRLVHRSAGWLAPSLAPSGGGCGGSLQTTYSDPSSGERARRARTSPGLRRDRLVLHETTRRSRRAASGMIPEGSGLGWLSWPVALSPVTAGSRPLRSDPRRSP